MAKSSEVVTGVDRLMDLLDKKSVISVADAAKELSVPRVVIEEWIDFLEEKGVIELEYKFTTPYITKKQLTKTELEKKEKDFSGKREGFVRKIESAYKALEYGTDSIRQLKQEFEELDREIERGSEKIRNELLMLEKFESLKKDIDRELRKAQDNFRKSMEAISREVLGRKNEYEMLSKHIKEQELKIDEEIAKSQLMPKNESILKERLKKIEEEAKRMQGKVSMEKSTSMYADNLKKLKGIARKLEEGIKYRQNEIAPLLEKQKGHEQKIADMQKKLIEKMADAKKQAGNSEWREIKQKMEKYFGKKKNMEAEFKRTDSSIAQLKSELKMLYAEARAIKLTSKSSPKKDYMADLEKRFRKTEEKKKVFEREIVNLGNLFKRK